MFKIGDYIIYGSNGVCKVESIGAMNMMGTSKERDYYTLRPVYETGGVVYTPVDNDKVVMRLVLTSDDAKQLVDEINNIEILWVPEEKKREDIYKAALKTCECREWIKIIKTLYLRKKDRIASGKKVTSSDEKYLKLAQENLYGELAVSLNMEKDKVEDYITKRLTILEKLKFSSIPLL